MISAARFLCSRLKRVRTTLTRSLARSVVVQLTHRKSESGAQRRARRNRRQVRVICMLPAAPMPLRSNVRRNARDVL